jgi:CubicO group peptidase (beta-lactamase class C family)
MPYEKYVAEHVFRRAEMTSTGYSHSDKPEPDMAIGYTRRGGDGLRSNIDMHGAMGSAAGGGYSTAMDLLTYVKSHPRRTLPQCRSQHGHCRRRVRDQRHRRSGK